MGKGGEAVATDKAVEAPMDKVQANGAEFQPLQITKKEMAKHNTVSDCWMSIGTRVYNMSNWHEHPGGSVIFTHSGSDMTDVFNMFHPPDASNLLKQFYIGDLVDDEDEVAAMTPEEMKTKEDQVAFEKAYRRLRSQMKKAGLFKINYWYYAYKIASQFLLVGLAAWCASSPTYAGFFSGAALLGLFWQQSGWLCHDVCHNQLAQQNGQPFSHWNQALGLMFGNLAQGFSVKWWKDKHNRHHAVPNVHGSGDGLNGDPDIDTMPLLAWSLKMAETGKDSNTARFMIGIQKFSYIPLLTIARLSWLQQGIQFCWNVESDGIFTNATKSEELNKLQKAALSGTEKYIEQALLILHHVWVFSLCSLRPSFLSGLGFWFSAQATCGILLFLVTSLGHNGLVVYEANERPDYWKLQVTTTRNISGNWFVHWLCGGLEYQVDHHLFPTMPRHSLPKAHELIVSFCKEHDLKYHEDDLFNGTMDIIKHLDQIAQEFITEFPAM